MSLRGFLNNTRFRLDVAVGEALHRLSGLKARRREGRNLELAELEGRVLLSASPVPAVPDLPDSMDWAGLGQADDMGLAQIAESVAALSAQGTDPADLAAEAEGFAKILAPGGEHDTIADLGSQGLRLVDSVAEEYRQLFEDLVPRKDWTPQIEGALTGVRDGIDQVTEALAGHESPVPHQIIAGAADEVARLSETWSDSDHLTVYTEQIAHLQDVATMHLADSQAGQALVEATETLSDGIAAAIAESSPASLVQQYQELATSTLEEWTGNAQILAATPDLSQPLAAAAEAVDQLEEAAGLLAAGVPNISPLLDVSAQADLPAVASALLGPTDPPAASALLSVGIDAPDYEQLIDDYSEWLNDLPVGLPFQESYRDGIQQIGQALAAYNPLDAAQLVTEVTEGAVELGSAWLHSDVLAAYGTHIEALRDTLTEIADLLG
jgi:hypothetical protein